MSDPPPLDANLLVRKVAESGMGIRFARGVVAKTGYVVAGLIVLWLAIAIKIGPSLIENLFLVACGLVITGTSSWWVAASLKFAERNPAQAILDGAEFVEYKRIEAEAKGGVVASGHAISEDAPAALPRKGR